MSEWIEFKGELPEEHARSALGLVICHPYNYPRVVLYHRENKQFVEYINSEPVVLAVTHYIPIPLAPWLESGE